MFPRVPTFRPTIISTTGTRQTDQMHTAQHDSTKSYSCIVYVYVRGGGASRM